MGRSSFGGTHVRSRTASRLAARRASCRLSAPPPDGRGSDRPPPPGNHRTLSDPGQADDTVSEQTTGVAHILDHDARRARRHAVTPRAATASSASPRPTEVVNGSAVGRRQWASFSPAPASSCHFRRFGSGNEGLSGHRPP